MLLHYHWGHGVGHVYSHTTRTEAGSHGNHAPTPTNTCNPISDLGDFEPDVDPGDQARAHQMHQTTGRTLTMIQMILSQTV